jgi:hypothetical protein
MSEWISVGERLPEYGEKVWVRINGWKNIATGYLFDCRLFEKETGRIGWVVDGLDHVFVDVTHWMPLPEPPASHNPLV